MKRKVLSILGLVVLFLSAVNGLAFAREAEPGDDRRGRGNVQTVSAGGAIQFGEDRGLAALLRHREPEPDDDRVNNTMMRHGEPEPGDDRGGRELELGDDRGMHPEPGDDHGGHGELEPGDDHGNHGGGHG